MKKGFEILLEWHASNYLKNYSNLPSIVYLDRFGGPYILKYIELNDVKVLLDDFNEKIKNLK